MSLPLHVKISHPTDGNQNVELLENIHVDILGFEITIYAGLHFDGASIPRFLWTLFGSPFTGLYLLAAVVHDALYASEGLVRKLSDDIFKALIEENVKKVYDPKITKATTWKERIKFKLKRKEKLAKAWFMYKGVRLGGSFVWKKHSKQSVKKNKKYIKIEKVKK